MLCTDEYSHLNTESGKRTVWFACVTDTEVMRGSAAWALRLRRTKLGCRWTGEVGWARADVRRLARHGAGRGHHSTDARRGPA